MHQERCRALGAVNEQDALTSPILSCRNSTGSYHIYQIGEKKACNAVYACRFFPTEILKQKISVIKIFHNFVSANLYRASRSTILSTAILEAAQARIFDPRLTSCNIISIIVVVFPVPGGP